MKKFILWAVILGMLIGLTGCGTKEAGAEKEYVFTDGKHLRNEQYGATFQTKFVEAEGVTLHVESGIYEEETAKKILEAVQTDYEVLKKKGSGSEGKVTLYVLKSTVKENPQAVKNEVFCTPDEIFSGAYRQALVKAAFGITGYWKKVGLEAFFFGKDGDSDLKKLESFYQEKTHARVLSLMPAYFNETFADAATRKAAEATACLLTEYMVDTYGLQAFLEEKEISQRCEEWLEQKGITQCRPPENRVNLAEMQADSDREHPLILQFQNYTLYFEKLDWLEDADDIYDFLKETFEGYETLLNQIKTEKPEIYEDVMENTKNPIAFYFGPYRHGLSHGKNQAVYISDRRTVFHEMFHLLIPRLKDQSQWYYEGLVTYLTEEMTSAYQEGWEKQAFYDGITKSGVYQEFSPDDQKFMDYVSNYYTLYQPLPEDAASLDNFIFHRAVGMVTLKYPKLPTTLTMAKLSVKERRGGNIYDYSEEKKQEGNYLTYAESMVYIEYLAVHYGLDTVLAVAKGRETFEEAFGGTYQTILPRVVDWIPAL